ncbi:MAG: glutathione S-transferase family protein [Caulobacter sp.]|nr:glutathione S-transferase family protein [Caulobacter sp.]
MKLYTSVGPNPRAVRMFAAEKGLSLPVVEIDLMGGENRAPPYRDQVNPAGQTPALLLDDGAVITEITVICEYLEEVHPSPTLIGATPAERAETRMWTRRIDLNICEPLANGFRAAEGRGLFESRMKLVGAEGANELKAIARDRILWLDGLMAGRQYICGDRFSLADILLFAFLDFGATVGQPLPDQAAWVKAWFSRMQARPSAAA